MYPRYSNVIVVMLGIASCFSKKLRKIITRYYKDIDAH